MARAHGVKPFVVLSRARRVCLLTSTPATMEWEQLPRVPLQIVNSLPSQLFYTAGFEADSRRASRWASIQISASRTASEASAKRPRPMAPAIRRWSSYESRHEHNLVWD